MTALTGLLQPMAVVVSGTDRRPVRRGFEQPLTRQQAMVAGS